MTRDERSAPRSGTSTSDARVAPVLSACDGSCPRSSSPGRACHRERQAVSLAELVADVSPVTARRGPDVFVGDRTGGPLAPSRRASTPHLDPHASLAPARVSKHVVRVSVSAPSNPGPPVGESEALFAAPIEDTETADSDEACKLTCTVDQEDAWLFEATRTLLDQLGALVKSTRPRQRDRARGDVSRSRASTRGCRPRPRLMR